MKAQIVVVATGKAVATSVEIGSEAYENVRRRFEAAGRNGEPFTMQTSGALETTISATAVQQCLIQPA